MRSTTPCTNAAAEAGLPVVIHSVEPVYPAFPFQQEQLRTSLAVHALAHPLSMVANLVSMLETVCRCGQAMFASDWPHHDFDHPQHVFGLPFSPEARARTVLESATEIAAGVRSHLASL